MIWKLYFWFPSLKLLLKVSPLYRYKGWPLVLLQKWMVSRVATIIACTFCVASASLCVSTSLKPTFKQLLGWRSLLGKLFENLHCCMVTVWKALTSFCWVMSPPPPPIPQPLLSQETGSGKREGKPVLSPSPRTVGAKMLWNLSNLMLERNKSGRIRWREADSVV